MNQKKIVFFTYHNWDAKRQGGFHKFAEYACRRGYDVLFFSFPRPLWTLLRNTDTFNFRKIIKLLKGITYKVHGNTLTNRTILSLSLPVPPKFNKFIPIGILNFFEVITFPRFERFAKKYFNNIDYFVFESTASVLFVDLIKKLFPNSKIIYRPSDPLIAFDYGKRFKKQELTLLRTADMVFLVNDEGLNLYRKFSPDFDSLIKYRILSNGVDLDDFKKTYPCPEPLKKGNTALYIGALSIDWGMILEASNKAPDVNFIIICPAGAPSFFLDKIKEIHNVIFINGIARNEVPQWVTNADSIIVPYPKDWYKLYPWGITAKYYQAMAAKKPIIAYHDSPSLLDLGIPVTYNVDDFINAVRESFKIEKKEYPINLNEKDWLFIADRFYNEIENIV